MSSNSSSPPAPGSIRERAEALCALVREESAASERLGRLTDKVVGELLQAGLFSVLLPESAGGWEGRDAISSKPPSRWGGRTARPGGVYLCVIR